MSETPSKSIRYAICTLAFLGALAMAYLLFMHYAPTPEGGSFCDLAEGLSCDVVNKSGYSELFGFPMALFGILYFLTVLILASTRWSYSTLAFIGSFMIALLGPALLLSYNSATVLENFCIFCEGSKLIMITIIALSIAGTGWQRFGSERLLISVGIALALTSMNFVLYTLTIPEPFTFEANLGPMELLQAITR